MRNLIFDFDGTICDSFQDSVRVMNELAARYGYEVIAEGDFESLKDCGFTEFKARLKMPTHKLPLIIHEGRSLMKSRMERSSRWRACPRRCRRSKAAA